MTSDPVQSSDFDRLVALLESRKGKDNGVTINAITHLLNFPNRRYTEHLIESRFLDFPWVVVAGNNGIYRPANVGEINTYANNLRKRLAAIRRRLDALYIQAGTAGITVENDEFKQPTETHQRELFR